MFKLILCHPGINLKQKLYLFYTYCFCYFWDWFLYGIEKYFIELNKLLIAYLRTEKMRKKWKKLYKYIKKKEIRYHKSWSKRLSIAGKNGAKAGKRLKEMITPTKKAGLKKSSKSFLYVTATDEMAQKWSKKNFDLKNAKVEKKIKIMITPTKKAQEKLKSLGINFNFKTDDKFTPAFKKIIQKQKDELYSHIIKNNLGFDQANEILKLAGFFGNRGMNILDLFKDHIDIRKYRILFCHYNSEKKLNEMR